MNIRPGKHILTVLLILAAGIGACGGGGASSSPAPPKTWTFLIYMDGDNSLSASVKSNITQMENVGSSQYVNIIVELSLPYAATRRYKIVKGDWQQIADLGQVYLAAPQPLTDFLKWGSATYPADRTVVILWDHGNGWDQGDPPSKPTRSMFLDQNNGNRYLANYKVRQAIENANIKIDILGMDESEMATIEALYEFRNLAPIEIAHQETGFSGGWNYNTIFTALAANPGMSADDLAREVVAAYRDELENVYYPSLPPLATVSKIYNISAIHTMYLDSLVKEADTLATSLSAKIADPSQKSATLASIAGARQGVQQLLQDFLPDVYVDLSDLASKLDGGSKIPGIVSQAVFAEYHGAAEPNDHGISIVFFKMPDALQNNAYDANYKNWDAATNTGNHGAFINSYNWDEFLHAYYVAQGYLPN